MAKFYRTEDRTVLLELFGAGSSVENLKNLKANTTDAAVEKHVPVVTQEGNKITVAVSSVEHPMLPEHYIMGVYIETKNGGQLHKFQPGDTPRATFTLADGDEFVAAYEYCNLHGLWKDKQEFAAGKETPRRESSPYICDFSRGGLNTRLHALVSKPCSETTNMDDEISMFRQFCQFNKSELL